MRSFPSYAFIYLFFTDDGRYINQKIIRSINCHQETNSQPSICLYVYSFLGHSNSKNSWSMRKLKTKENGLCFRTVKIVKKPVSTVYSTDICDFNFSIFCTEKCTNNMYRSFGRTFKGNGMHCDAQAINCLRCVLSTQEHLKLTKTGVKHRASVS